MKRCRRIVGAALALLLGSALLVLLFALWPAPVINAVARYGLGLELSVGTINYRVHNGRLLCHIQQLSYRHSPPALDLKLEHLAVDVNLKRLRNKHIIVNDLAVIGADLAIEQGGATPWWREFTAASPSAPEDEHASDTQWRLNVRSIQGKDIHLRVDLLLQQRQNALRITRLSSGQSPHQKRWLQIRGAINDYPLHVDGQVMAIGSKLDRIDPFDISWEVRLADAFLRADGRMLTDVPLQQMLRHFDHLISIAGENRVGFGSDFDGALIPREIRDASGLQNLTAVMRDNGYGDDLIRKLCHENWLRVLEKTWGG